MNFEVGGASAVNALVPLSGGRVCVYGATTVHVVIDVTGYIEPSAPVTILPTPSRLADTRQTGRLGAGGVLRIPLAGRDGGVFGAGVFVGVVQLGPHSRAISRLTRVVRSRQRRTSTLERAKPWPIWRSFRWGLMGTFVFGPRYQPTS